MSGNHLAMSDEDFLNELPPETAGASSQETPQKTDEELLNQKTPDKVEETLDIKADEKPEKDQAKDPEVVVEKTAADLAAEAALALEEAKKNPTDEGNKGKDADVAGSKEGEAASEKEAEKSSETPPDYEAVYKQIMAPFKANGKTIEMKDSAEVIQLMQLGANYTRKLQELAPQRKIITMLGNHGLLDESKLSFLIALDNKDPEAIKKLIIDSGIDPLDIDTKTEPTYTEGSYAVTDEEVAFRTQLDELTSTDTGKQTLQVINSNWDQASKDALWQQPAVMTIIHEQRESGIYTKITDEMDRQITLGQLKPTVPFLEAYKMVGDHLLESGAFGESTSEKDTTQPKVEVLADTETKAEKPVPVVVAQSRVATPRPSVENGDKAGAASPSRSAPGKAKESVNFLAMSDDDFLKASNLEGRV